MYGNSVSRRNPGCFVFLVDQSASMEVPICDGGETKAQVVADAVNRAICELVIASVEGESAKVIFFVAVIGYGGIKNVAAPCFEGALTDRFLVPINELAENPLRVELRTITISDGVGD